MYRLNPLAKQDVRKIYKFTKKNFGQTQADKYYNQLFDTFEKLDKGHINGKDYDIAHPKAKGYRIESHVVFFLRSGKNTEIIRVLHKSMDYIRHA